MRSVLKCAADTFERLERDCYMEFGRFFVRWQSTQAGLQDTMRALGRNFLELLR